MKPEWSDLRKKLLYWVILIAAATVLILIGKMIGDNPIVQIVGTIIGGLLLLFLVLAFLWEVIQIPREISKNRKQREELKYAKWVAYDFIDSFGVFQLKKDVNPDHMIEREKSYKMDEIIKTLSHKLGDNEAKHLLYDLGELRNCVDKVLEARNTKSKETSNER